MIDAADKDYAERTTRRARINKYQFNIRLHSSLDFRLAHCMAIARRDTMNMPSHPKLVRVKQ